MKIKDFKTNLKGEWPDYKTPIFNDSKLLNMQDHATDAMRYYIVSMGVKKVVWYKLWYYKVRRFILRIIKKWL